MDRIVGVDISKARLDVLCRRAGAGSAVDDAAGVAELAAWLRAGQPGGYGGLRRLRAARCTGFWPSAASRRPWSTRCACASSPRPRASWPRPIASTLRRSPPDGAFVKPVPTPVWAGVREALAELLGYRRQLLAELGARSQQLAHLALARPDRARQGGAGAAAPRQGGASPGCCRTRSPATRSCRPRPPCSRARPRLLGAVATPLARVARARRASTGARSRAWSAWPPSPGIAA